LNLILILTPEVLDQVIKRNPAIAEALGKLGASISQMPSKAYDKITSKAAKEAKAKSQELLKEHLAKLKGPSDEVLKWREFYNQKIIEKKKLGTDSK